MAARRERRAGFDLQRDLVGRPDPVVFDVGAHVGRVAKEYRRRFPAAALHCFEPFPPAFDALCRRRSGDPRTECHPLALAASEGQALLHVNAGVATNSLLPADARGSGYWGPDLMKTQRTLEVRTSTVDAFCTARGIGRIDVLKLDVQGAEREVLTGAHRMLSEQRVGLVYMEVLLAPSYVGQAALHEHLNLLAGHGFTLFALFDQVLRRRRLIQADALFVSRGVLEAYEALVP
jgi:FkbM family methyltransferase